MSLCSRRPSLKTMVGHHLCQKGLYRAVGITALNRPFQAPGNAVRRIKRHVGYSSGPMKFLRYVMHRPH